jgi:hypothetical protein
MTGEAVIEELVLYTNQSRGSVIGLLAELDGVIERALTEGHIVQLPNGMHFRPTMQRDGTIDVCVRINPDVLQRINARFRGRVRNAANMGKSEAEVIALWDEDHPDDPVET